MLTKTNIEYGEKNWNFYPGCLHWKNPEICPVGEKCWAKTTTEGRMQESFEPHLIPENLLDPLRRKKPTRILVNFRGDLMGGWVDPNQNFEPQVLLTRDHTLSTWGSLKDQGFQVINSCPQHQFLFLTKNPAGYAKWGAWPDNAWIGATVCNDEMLVNSLFKLCKVWSSHKWLSIEPLMDRMYQISEKWLKDAGISWVVIGGWSQGKKQPEISWIREIVEACDKAGIPVWLKDNLELLLGQDLQFKRWKGTDKDGNNLYGLRQQLPEAQ